MKESYPLSPFSPCLPSAPALERFWKWSLKPKEWLRVMLEAVEQAGDGDGVGGVSCHTQMQPLKGQAWGAAQSAIWSIVGPIWSIAEELVDFWILVEKILSIDEMDLEVRDHYLSLLFVLRATHLQESSRVLTLCNMNISKNHKVYLRWNPWEKKKSIQCLILLSLLPCRLLLSPLGMTLGTPTLNREWLRETVVLKLVCASSWDVAC